MQMCHVQQKADVERFGDTGSKVQTRGGLESQRGQQPGPQPGQCFVTKTQNPSKLQLIKTEEKNQFGGEKNVILPQERYVAGQGQSWLAPSMGRGTRRRTGLETETRRPELAQGRRLPGEHVRPHQSNVSCCSPPKRLLLARAPRSQLKKKGASKRASWAGSGTERGRRRQPFGNTNVLGRAYQVVPPGRASGNRRVLFRLLPLKYVHSPLSLHILQSRHTFLVDNSGRLSGFFFLSELTHQMHFSSSHDLRKRSYSLKNTRTKPPRY